MSTKNQAAVRLGRLGGKRTTQAQAEARRLNGRKGGRPVVWSAPVSDQMKTALIGTHRIHGTEWTTTVADLYRSASDSDGVYGPDNTPVHTGMTVRQLADWHCDYKWRIK